jgi:hypothetical protein
VCEKDDGKMLALYRETVVIKKSRRRKRGEHLNTTSVSHRRTPHALQLLVEPIITAGGKRSPLLSAHKATHTSSRLAVTDLQGPS